LAGYFAAVDVVAGRDVDPGSRIVDGLHNGGVPRGCAPVMVAGSTTGRLAALVGGAT
jgi:hypothetical protein